MHRVAPAPADSPADCSREARERCLAHAHVDAAHGERARLARELHDGPAQALAALQVRLTTLGYRGELAALPGIRQELAELSAACREALHDVRREIRGLRACSSPDAGFADTVRALAARFAAETGVRVDADVADVEPPPAASGQVIRVACEALTNVRKHADAARVSVRVRGEGGAVVLEIADDGAGFDPRALPPDAEGYGLEAMRQRAGAVGGTLEIDSRPGAGTTVRLSAPLAASVPAR